MIMRSTLKGGNNVKLKIFLGIIVALIGLFFVVCSRMKSQNKFYQVFVKSGRTIWKDNVYFFHTGIGVIIMVLGIFYAIQFIWT